MDKVCGVPGVSRRLILHTLQERINVQQQAKVIIDNGGLDKNILNSRGSIKTEVQRAGMSLLFAGEDGWRALVNVLQDEDFAFHNRVALAERFIKPAIAQHGRDIEVHCGLYKGAVNSFWNDSPEGTDYRIYTIFGGVPPSVKELSIKKLIARIKYFPGWNIEENNFGALDAAKELMNRREEGWVAFAELVTGHFYSPSGMFPAKNKAGLTEWEAGILRDRVIVPYLVATKDPKARGIWADFLRCWSITLPAH